MNFYQIINFVNDIGARKAIMKTRLCVATFRLNKRQMAKFYYFFVKNPKGILTNKKIKSVDVLGIEFADIYWDKSDLSSDEINSYNKYMNNLKKKIVNSVYN